MQKSKSPKNGQSRPNVNSPITTRTKDTGRIQHRYCSQKRTISTLRNEFGMVFLRQREWGDKATNLKWKEWCTNIPMSVEHVSNTIEQENTRVPTPIRKRNRC